MKILYTSFLLDATSGYAEAARRILAAMNAVGIEAVPGVTLTDGNGQMRPEGEVAEFLERKINGRRPDLHLVFAAACDYPGLRIPGLSHYGLTCYETDTLHRSFVDGCAGFRKILVPSKHNVEVFQEAELQVALVPYPVLWPPPSKAAADIGFGITDSTFCFYSVFTMQERKNPRGLLVAYLTTFAGSDDIALLLKVGGPNAEARARRELQTLIGTPGTDDRGELNLPDPPKVIILPGAWHSLWPLHVRGDCYVTLTRGESYCLPLADALAAGNRVIAPDWGGQVDLLYSSRGRREGVRLVQSRLTPVVQRYPYFDGSQAWGDPDLCQAGERMWSAFAEGRRAPIAHDLSSFSPEAVGRKLLEALSGH